MVRDHGLLLVVDDDPMIRGLLAESLRSGGYRVLEVGTGLEAIHAIDLAYARHTRPCAILLDMMLPGADGAAVMRHLKSRGLSVPVIAISASGMHLASARMAGAVETVAKPFDLGDLLTLVGRYCSPQA